MQQTPRINPLWHEFATRVRPASGKSNGTENYGPSLLADASVQPGVAVGAVDDAFEREAGRMAERVMCMPGPGAAAGMAEPLIQRAAAPRGGGDSAAQRTDSGHDHGALTLSSAALTSGGVPLPGAVRTFFEPRFARDFSAVRITRRPSGS
jgi:hypothetical protein